MANIVAIDDDTDILLVLQDVLQLEGHAVRTSTSASTLPSMLQEQSADLIILDVDMPDVLGFEVLRTLRTNPKTASVPVMFLSAHDHSDYRVEGLRAGAVDYVGKPFHPDELALRVDIALRNKTPSSREVRAPREREPAGLREQLSTGRFEEGVLIGRYTVIDQLGRGSFGSVLSAWDPTLKRSVAIKVLTLDDASNEERQQAAKLVLAKECAALAGLNHSNILQIFDGGEADGLAYFVMELASGASLRRVLDVLESPFHWADALRVLQQLVAAVAYAHSKSVIHRDIKPSNIMLTAQGQCKLADFGLMLVANELIVDAGSALAGTPRYVAPEVLLDGPPTPASDVFSLGCVFYEMLTRRNAFPDRKRTEDGGSTAESFLVTLREDVTPPVLHCPEVPKPVSDFACKLLSTSPADRPTVHQMHEAILGLVELPGTPATGLAKVVTQALRIK